MWTPTPSVLPALSLLAMSFLVYPAAFIFLTMKISLMNMLETPEFEQHMKNKLWRTQSTRKTFLREIYSKLSNQTANLSTTGQIHNTATTISQNIKKYKKNFNFWKEKERAWLCGVSFKVNVDSKDEEEEVEEEEEEEEKEGEEEGGRKVAMMNLAMERGSNLRRWDDGSARAHSKCNHPPHFSDSGFVAPL